MASIVDEYLDTQSENDDLLPCKGCGEILEEGKAFELAGNRWHLDCFRCNTCNTLLDSDANLLLLGDGSLICNNCTYSCSACGNKIEDLAILTGDQAFCSTCFRCRNCKRKIENLRYARTSQGIFCMGCHETLMARRRKKSKASAAAKAREKEHASPMIKEKSLPALPPNEIPKNAFSNERVDPDSDTPTEISSQPRQGQRPSETVSRGSSRPRSPERQSKPEGLGLSSHAYRSNRSSTMMSNDTDKDDGFFIPVVLDPSPGPPSTSTSTNDAARKKDYFGSAKPSGADKRTDSQSSTPHIAFQEKGRQHSVDRDQVGVMLRKQSADERPPRAPPRSDDFRLQEVPKGRKPTPSTDGSLYSAQHDGARQTPPPLSESRKNSENILPPRRSHDIRGQEQDDVRPSIDSASARPSARTENSKIVQRKEVPNNAAVPQTRPEQPGSEGLSDENPPPRPPRPSAPSADSQKGQPKSYMHPRMAPPPPGLMTGQEYIGPKDGQDSEKISPKLPRWSSGGDFTMDEDMARIMGGEAAAAAAMARHGQRPGKHGRNNSAESSQAPTRTSHVRSVSETARGIPSPLWSRSTGAEDGNSRTSDMISPTSTSSADDTAVLKRQLRNSEQKVAELERKFNTEADLKNLNKKLIEKRKTVSVLDSQAEIMIRQLEVLAGYVEKAKETKEPIDSRKLEDAALKEFVQKLEHVRMSMSESIEQLHEERNQLLEEKTQAMADRDRALMEFEQLSSKNAQLADMNNEMTHQLQERFRSQAAESKGMNGLGIYGDKAASLSSTNLENASMTTTLIAADDDSIMEGEPTVVHVRKGQIKKFNWKKGSKGLAQGLTKGVNRAVVAFQQNDRGERVQTTGLAGDNIGMPYNTTVVPVESPSATTPTTRPGQVDQSRQGFGFFRQKSNVPKPTSSNASLMPLAAEPPSTLFGSDLSERADYERRQIPSVVTRCIEEVELRGMDQEGIYRKTGGNSQVNTIKDGIDKSEDFDISDPDIDITAVTSVLKQYFRKLPIPLLSYDVYDRVLESVAIVDEKERCDHLRRTFDSLPDRHRDCLEFLMFHLDRVAQRQSENLMTTKNLAVVFAPTIMFDRSIEREMTDMHAKNLAVQFVIENSRTIFAEP